MLTEKRNQNKTIISLIIPAYNEENYLVKTLKAVNKARNAYIDPLLIEIIVVDNCSTDKTKQIAKKYQAKVVSEKKRCIAAVRNKGAKIAKGKIIGFLDADSIVTKNIFNSIEKAISSDEYIGGGTIIKLERNSLGIFFTYLITVIPARFFLGVAGGLIFMEKKIFNEIGGFDETLFCAEDSKFILDLKRLGKKIGRKFKIITSDHIVTSARAFDIFGDWYYFKNIPKVLLKSKKNAFRDKKTVKRFWYDVR